MSTHADRCAEWRELASCRLDGELDELQRARLEHHLAGCAACRTWAHEVAALAGMLHESESELPVWTFEGTGNVLRRRFVRAAAVGATAASAAAVAAFAFALPGARMSLFSSGNAPLASPAPSASLTKKQALTFELGTSSSPRNVGPKHVANPTVEPK